eukprot:100804_1
MTAHPESTDWIHHIHGVTFSCHPSKHFSLKHAASPFTCCFNPSVPCISIYEESRSPDVNRLNHGKCICKDSFIHLSPIEYVKESWGSWNNFLLSYGLKPWNSDDEQQGILIATKFMKHAKIQWIQEHKKCKQNSVKLTTTSKNKRMCSNCCMRFLISTDNFNYFKTNIICLSRV